MTDLSQTVAPKSDQMNADDLISGPRTITITRVTGNEGNAEQPVNVFFEGDGGKPFRPCKSMRRVMIAVWGPDGNSYSGRRMTLYRDPKVTFGGMQVGGIRISHMSDMPGDRQMTMALTASKAKRAPYVVKPIASALEEQSGPDPIEEAKKHAGKGTDAFRAFWNSDFGKMHRERLSGHVAEFQKIAAEADKHMSNDDDPFGLPSVSDEQTPEDIAKAEAEALAEIERQHREATA